MGNKVKYNLKNVHAAKLKETVSSSGETTFSYENPKAIPEQSVSASMQKGNPHRFMQTASCISVL